MSAETLLIIKIVDLLLLGATLAPQVAAAFRSLRAELQVFADEGRDPTPEEWNTLNARLQSKVDSIMSD